MRRLSSRLILIFATILAALTVYQFIVSAMATKTYLQTVDQSLHSGLAAQILQENLLSIQEGLSDSSHPVRFKQLMSVNPNAEFYLIDKDGKITSYSAPTGRIKLTYVDLGPIQSFLEKTQVFPIFGVDPREPDNTKVFSVAPIDLDGTRAGYVYVILGSEKYRSIASMFQTSHTLRLSLWLMLGGVVAAFAAGAVAFHALGRRVFDLACDMESVDASGFRNQPLTQAPERARDEIDTLTNAFLGMTDRIRKQVLALEKLNSSRRELFLHISHDLRTPLSTIQVYLETVAMKWDELDASTRAKYLNSALTFVQKLDTITADLFELTTLDFHKEPQRPERFSLAELVQDVAQGYQPQAHDKGLNLIVKVDECNNKSINCDIGLIERAISNLIDNAIKFTPVGGLITVSVSRDEFQARVSVSDTGVGIPEEDIERIFDRFHRVKGSEENVEGTGLGLAIAKRIVELHSGTISVESSIGKGTKFTISLPAVY